LQGELPDLWRGFEQDSGASRWFEEKNRAQGDFFLAIRRAPA
jgi:hypothetical protein